MADKPNVFDEKFGLYLDADGKPVQRRLRPGPKPRDGSRPMSGGERQAAYMARLKAAAEGSKPLVRYRKPADRRTRPQRWADAVQTLADLIDDYQSWRDGLPASLADSAIADRLDDLLQLRELVDQLAAADLPKGFGRD